MIKFQVEYIFQNEMIIPILLTTNYRVVFFLFLNKKMIGISREEYLKFVDVLHMQIIKI